LTAANLILALRRQAPPGRWTVKDLVAGSGFAFTDRGSYRLKGVPEPWQLFSVELAPRSPVPSHEGAGGWPFGLWAAVGEAAWGCARPVAPTYSR
jgi:hypothetical protein